MSTIKIFYYRLDVPPERVRRAFPRAIEFRNPNPESFTLITTSVESPSLLVIDVEGDKDRRIFVARESKKLIVINDNLPMVFVIPRKRLDRFFQSLVKGKLVMAGKNPGTRKRGLYMANFLLSFIITVISLSADHNSPHKGLWVAILSGMAIASVGYFFNPRRSGISALRERYVKRMYKTFEKKGMVERVFL